MRDDEDEVEAGIPWLLEAFALPSTYNLIAKPGFGDRAVQYDIDIDASVDVTTGRCNDSTVPTYI